MQTHVVHKYGVRLNDEQRENKILDVAIWLAFPQQKDRNDRVAKTLSRMFSFRLWIYTALWKGKAKTEGGKIDRNGCHL